MDDNEWNVRRASWCEDKQMDASWVFNKGWISYISVQTVLRFFPLLLWVIMAGFQVSIWVHERVRKRARVCQERHRIPLKCDIGMMHVQSCDAFVYWLLRFIIISIQAMQKLTARSHLTKEHDNTEQHKSRDTRQTYSIHNDSHTKPSVFCANIVLIWGHFGGKWREISQWEHTVCAGRWRTDRPASSSKWMWLYRRAAETCLTALNKQRWRVQPKMIRLIMS